MAGGERCPDCRRRRLGYLRFCLGCGFDFDVLRQAATPATKPVVTPATPSPATPPRPAAPPPPIARARSTTVGPASTGAPAVRRPAATTAATAVTRAVPVTAVAPTIRPARQLHLVRYAVIGALALFSVGAISYALAPGGDVSRVLLPLTGAPPSPGEADPGIGSAASDAPGAAPTAITVDDEPVVVDIGDRQTFEGLMGTYAWSSLAFPGDRVTVRWTASASSKGDCVVTWRVEATNGNALSGTIEVEAGDDEAGNGRYDTPFDDARFTVDSTCVTWALSMEGFSTQSG